MDEKYISTIWNILSKSIQGVRHRNPNISQDEVYNQAFTVVTNKHGFHIYNGLSDLLTDQVMKKLRMELVETASSDFLNKLQQSWLHHQVTMRMLNDILGYMNDTYIKIRGQYTIYKLGVVIFRNEIVRHKQIATRLREQLLAMVNEDRLGNEFKQEELKNAIGMLFDLGVDSRYTYVEFFENSLILQTSEYYEMKSAAIKDDQEFIKQRKLWINAENLRAEKYFDKETGQRIEQLLKGLVRK